MSKDEPPAPSRPFLKRGTGSAKYAKMRFPVLEKCRRGSDPPTAPAHLTPERNDVHYASSPVRPLRGQRLVSERHSPEHQIQMSQFEIPPLRFDDKPQRHGSQDGIRADSGRGSRGTDSLPSSARPLSTEAQPVVPDAHYQCEPAGMNSPEYIPASSRTGDSGFAVSEGIPSPDRTGLDFVGEFSAVDRTLEPIRSDAGATHQLEQAGAHNNGERIFASRLSDRGETIANHAGPSEPIGSNRDQSLVSFERHESSILKRVNAAAAARRGGDIVSPGSLSLSSIAGFSERTQLHRNEAKAFHRAVQLEEVGMLKSEEPIRSHSGPADSGSQAGTMDGLSSISSIHPSIVPSSVQPQFTSTPMQQRTAQDGLRPAQFVSRVSAAPQAQVPSLLAESNFFERDLGPLRPFDDVVPPLFDNKSVASSILNVRPSQATIRQLPRARIDAAHQVDISTPSGSRPSEATRTGRFPRQVPSGPAPLRVSPGPESAESTPRQSSRSEILSSRLVEQLRDAIINMDFAEAEWRRKKREIIDSFAAEKLALEQERERLKVEEERVQREKASVERSRKTLRRGDAEREKDREKENDDFRKLNTQLSSQLSDLRLKERRMEEERKKLNKENADLKTKNGRLENRITQLQREMAQQRGRAAHEKARTDREEAARSRIRPAFDRSRRTSTGDTASESSAGSNPDPTPGLRNGALKTVTWADAAAQNSRTDQSSSAKILSETLKSEFGTTQLYRSTSGDWTKVTPTPCGCIFYEYRNGDVFWTGLGCEMYYYAVTGATEVKLAGGVVVRHFLTKQVEISRPSGEVILIQPDETRIEMKRSADGGFFAERIHTNGDVYRLRGQLCDKIATGVGRSTFGTPYQLACDESGVSFWVKDGNMKMDVHKLGVQMQLLASDDGVLKHVRWITGQKVKLQCVRWGASVRREGRSGSVGHGKGGVCVGGSADRSAYFPSSQQRPLDNVTNFNTSNYV